MYVCIYYILCLTQGFSCSYLNICVSLSPSSYGLPSPSCSSMYQSLSLRPHSNTCCATCSPRPSLQTPLPQTLRFSPAQRRLTVRVFPRASRHFPAETHTAAYMQRLYALRASEGGDMEGPNTRVFYGLMSWKLYLRTLQLLPSLSKQWFSQTDRATCHAVSTTTATYFSPLLARAEIAALNSDAVAHAANTNTHTNTHTHTHAQPQATSAGGMGVDDDPSEFKVKGSFDLQEISARFKKGDIAMTLVIHLSKAHPLMPVQVDFPEKLKVKETSIRSWQLMIVNSIASQNGTILAAMLTWKSNLGMYVMFCVC